MQIGEVVVRIGADAAPVLLCDTCALLDITRDPTREEFLASHGQSAIRLLERAVSAPRTLWLPVASQVLREIDDNRLGIMQDAKITLEKLEAKLEHLRLLMSGFGVNTTAITPGLIQSGFLNVVDGILTRFLTAGLNFQPPPETATDAYARIAANLAPSKKGQQAKDCLIIETYLQLARRLRASGLKLPIVFLTTNKNDYSDPNSKGWIHPELARDFKAAGLGYAVNFSMAEHLLK